jgi:hypothetical protein
MSIALGKCCENATALKDLCPLCLHEQSVSAMNMLFFSITKKSSFFDKIMALFS